MRRDQPQHGNQRNSPAADVEDLFVAEVITQFPPVSEGEELRDRGNAADDGEFHVGETEIPQHVESEIGSCSFSTRRHSSCSSSCARSASPTGTACGVMHPDARQHTTINIVKYFIFSNSQSLVKR